MAVKKYYLSKKVLLNFNPQNKVKGSYNADKLHPSFAHPSDKFDLQNYIEDVVDEMSPANVGTKASATTVSVSEDGDNVFHKTTITLTDFNIGTVTGGAAEAIGALMYTFPAGQIYVDDVAMTLSLQESDGNITLDTPDLGIGTTVASGAVAVLSGTAAFENILTGQTMDNVNGTAEVVAPTAADLNIASGGDKTVYLNIADTWAAGGESSGILATGTITIFWRSI